MITNLDSNVWKVSCRRCEYVGIVIDDIAENKGFVALCFCPKCGDVA